LKIALISNYADSLLSFRGPLLAELSDRGHEVVVCVPGLNPDLAEQLQLIGVASRSVSLDRTGTNPVRDFRFLQELTTFFRTTRPDIVLNYTIKPLIYGSLAAKFAGISNIFSVLTGLGYIFTGSSCKQKILRMFIFGLYRKALAANNLLFFLNPDDLNMFRDLGLIKEKTQIVLLPGEGISLEQFPSAQLPIEPVFLLIARLIRDKGIQEFVAAARLLRQSYPSISCRIVGPLDSNPTAFRADEVESWHREGIIEYLGEAKDIRQHMAAASVYVLPSYREGVPRTVLEAMSMGRPIVTTDVPGCRETVMAGENGFIVPVKDAAALAEAMERFILDPGLISKMGKRSREIAEEKFDVRKVNNLIIRSLGLDNEKGI